MSTEKVVMPDYLFEASWEVCNKVGGIHTVLASKSLNLSKELKNNHIHIGPDVWMDTAQNPEFTEDPILFRTWRMAAAEEGLRLRVGRWNIPGKPIAVLVDFSQFIPKKNEIFTSLWEKFKLDSISGQWDFIESALFGYAAGKVIESFVRFNLQPHHKVVAHFHEWMTGAGILYLKSVKAHVATIFTTHATVTGRCLACNNVPLYDSLSNCNADEKARYYNVTAKHSMEKCAALNADVFTTVSDITATECEKLLGKKVDLITPNGFDNGIVPPKDKLQKAAAEGRKVLLDLAGAMCGEDCSDAFILGISGRYEYKNKGIDVFLDVLGRLGNSGYSGRTVVAFIMVPSGHNGPDKELAAKLAGNGSDYRTLTTHQLQDPDSDIILNRMKALNLVNREGSKVKVFFVPSYLNGDDGIIGRKYYELLMSMDMTLFPSYYEPWGYTPLESLAFGVPTLTTTLAGFGLWVRSHYNAAHPSITIVPRNDSNYGQVVDNVLKAVMEMTALSPETVRQYKDNAVEVSEIALWKHNIYYYKQAYSLAIERLVEEMGAFPEYKEDQMQNYHRFEVNRPSWSRILVTRDMPERLKALDVISKNLWWCWNQEAMDLFRSINADLWKECERNPIALLDRLTLDDYNRLEADTDFLARMDAVYDIFNTYMDGKKDRKSPSIAYFSMEYGLDTSLKIYSGGLGILAGDYLKESSDMKVRMTGVGLLYRYGYFSQRLTAQGDQVADYEPQDFFKIPAMPVRDGSGNWKTVSIVFPGRTVYARIWRVDVGRTELYLLDTDFEDNLPEDRQITHHLYGGDWENRLKQELLLGIGGIRALRTLGIQCDIYHCNEGHAAFIGLERLREYVAQNLSFSEAMELVRCSSLFTTHTPVPAGHDAFSEDMLRTYINHYPQRMKIDWETLMALGKINPSDRNEKFSMSNLACNLSQEVNGVSWMHGKVSQQVLGGLWPGYLPEELHIGYVTNGVHYPTWTAPQWKEIHAKVFGPEFAAHKYDKKCFEGIYNVDDSVIWNVRNELRARMIEVVKKRISNTDISSHYSPHQIVTILDTLRSDVLTIGFARRFATYKRAHLLFRDLNRLNEIVNNPDRPVQFIFAGKAHPADKAGQDLIKRIVDISKMPQFIGKIVFVPNYDMNLAKALVQGVDVWMNTPTRPLEASGTSGEKAAMNGVMHFSVLDGWWIEGYKKDAGWALPMEKTYDDQNFQDELDAATIYNIIENEIAPGYYDERDRKTGIPSRWIQYIKNTIALVASNFTTNRMLTDYLEKYYMPLYERTLRLNADDCAVAKEIAFWKKNIRHSWQHIEIKDYVRPTDSNDQPMLGKERVFRLELFIGDINPHDIGVELVWAEQDRKGVFHVRKCFTFDYESGGDGTARYVCRLVPTATGVYYLTVRVFAKNDLLPHRQDLELVRWL